MTEADKAALLDAIGSRLDAIQQESAAQTRLLQLVVEHLVALRWVAEAPDRRAANTFLGGDDG